MTASESTSDDRPYVLVVDDEEANRDLSVRIFDDDFRLLVASSGDEALELLAAHEVAVVLSDHRMPGMTGVDLLATLAERWPDTRRVLVTAYSDRDLLLDAIRRGHVQEYVTKPWEVPDLRLRIEAGLASYLRARGLHRAERERTMLREEVERRAGLSEMIGLDRGLATIAATIAKVAASEAPIVIHGELGTGKELTARAIHKGSPRAGGPFVRVGCRSLGAASAADVLFAPGGAVEQARAGTLFLDEVAALDLDAQARLLGTLDDARVRVIAATREALDERTKTGAFREDLYFALVVLPLRLPPLRERKDDIGPLATHFARTLGAAMGKTLAISPAAIASLSEYDWPGNVRELRNVIERACVLADPITTLERDDILFDFAAPSATAAAQGRSLFEEISSEEAERVRAALKQAAGNRARAARALGIPRTTLADRIKKLGIV